MTEVSVQDKSAPYIMWAKGRPTVRNDLANSNLLACTLDDLPGVVAEVNGSNGDGYAPLMNAIAAQYETRADRITAAAGASGANFLAFAALVSAGDNVLVERPTYDPLCGALRMLGAHLHFFDRIYEEDWAINLERVTAALTPRTRLIVLTNPHNPTGALTPVDELRELGRIARRASAHVLVDEVYLDAVYKHPLPTAATLDDVFISTNSLTKAYGLGGLRAGWAIAKPELALAMRRARDVVDGVGCVPGEMIAAFAFQHMGALKTRARVILEPNLSRLSHFIDQRPDLEWVPPVGGTVAFPRVRCLSDTRAFADRLQREYETAVVPGAFFGEPGHIRIAFGCHAQTLEAGLKALGRALDRSPKRARPRL